jgi:predicted regulator of Ras-like GTPase activity (Roadblock/LC7/MglB family)
MLSEEQIVNTLQEIAADLPGFIAASLVDLDSGMTLGLYSKDASFDLNSASAFNSEMVKQKLKIINVLGLDGELEDMLLSLSDQIHLIRLVNPGTFLYLAADRKTSNLAIVRNAVVSHSRELAG